MGEEKKEKGGLFKRIFLRTKIVKQKENVESKKVEPKPVKPKLQKIEDFIKKSEGAKTKKEEEKPKEKTPKKEGKAVKDYLNLEELKGKLSVKKVKEKVAEKVAKVKEGAGKIPKKVGFFSKLYFIIKKDLKLLIRSKPSAVIFLLGPLIVFVLMSLAFNTSSLYNLRVAAYSESYTELTDNVIANLSDQQYIIEKVDSEATCLDSVKFENYQACVIFPKDLTIDTSDQRTVNIYVDESRLNIADFIAGQISAKVSLQASEISSGIVQQIIGVLDKTSEELNAKKTEVQEISSNSKDASTKLSAISTDLGGLDLGYSNYDSSTLKGYIDDLKDKNITVSGVSGILNDLEDGIDGFQSTYDSLAGKFATAASKVSDAKKNVDSVRASVEGGSGKADSVGSSITTLTEEISSIKVRDVESIVSPIDTSIEPISAKQTYVFYMFPTIVMLLVMFFSVLMGSVIIVREKESKAYFRSFIAPTNDFWFMIGTYLATILIVFIQTAFIFGAAAFFFKSATLPSLGLSAILLLIVATVFILVGMFLGYLFTSEETATLVSVCVSTVLLFFSNTLLPLETIAQPTIFWIVRFNPFVIGERVIKWFVLFGSKFGLVANFVYMLLSYVVLFFFLGFIARKISQHFQPKKG